MNSNINLGGIIGSSKRTGSPDRNMEVGFDKQDKPLLSGNKSVRTNEDDEEIQDKTMGSDRERVLKINTGDSL